MNKELIKNKQGIALILLFIVGPSSIITMGIEAKNDLWLATIVGFIMALPLIFVYARINYLFPGKSLFEIIEINFGKVIGKLINLLYTWFALHLSSLVLRDFGEFYVNVAAPQTPMIAPMIIISLLCIWAIKEGVETLGRWSILYFPIIIVFIIATVLLLIPKMQIMHLKPILYNGIKPVLIGGFSAFAFPFAETVIFIMVFSSLKEKSSYKVYFTGYIISGLLLFIISTTDLLVLGADRISQVYFPSYDTVRRLNVGNFIQRIEIVVSIVFLIGGFVKMSICLLGASKGIAHIFGYKDYRFIVGPMGLIMLNLSYLISDSIMEFIRWSAKIWKYYAFPFQVIIPLILLLVIEVKKYRKMSKS